MSFPKHLKYSGRHYHDFYIPGIRFSFFFGSIRVFEQEKTQVLFAEYSFSKSERFHALAFDFLTKIKPRGRLADEADPPTLN